MDISTLLVDGASAIAIVVALTALVRYVSERRKRRRTLPRPGDDDAEGGEGAGGCAAVVIVILAAAGAVALFQLAGHGGLTGTNYYRNLTIFLLALLVCLIAVSAAAIRQFAGGSAERSPAPLHNLAASAAAFLLLAGLIGGIVTGVVPITGVNVLPADTSTAPLVLLCTPTPEPTPTQRTGVTPTPTPRPSPTASVTTTPAQTPLPSACSTPG